MCAEAFTFPDKWPRDLMSNGIEANHTKYRYIFKQSVFSIYGIKYKESMSPPPPPLPFSSLEYSSGEVHILGRPIDLLLSSLKKTPNLVFENLTSQSRR